jgi:integrase
MPTYDVRVWAIYADTRGTRNSYTVRWAVAGQRKSKAFQTRALAESFRAKLLSSAREGIPYDEATGLPVTMVRESKVSPGWYEFACAYVDMKWPKAAGNTRVGIAEALATATQPLLLKSAGRPSEDRIRAALYGWSFNAVRRREPASAEVARTVTWIEQHCLRLGQMDDPAVMRRVLDRIALRNDGKPAAASTVARKRAVFHNALEYAVELGHLPSNPLSRVRWTAPKLAEAVDRRVVVNPEQAEALLRAVAEVKPSGPRFVAFFACMYYAAMRPGEVSELNMADCILPEEGWGELLLWRSAPVTGKAWTNDATTRDARQLKHRSVQDTRPVPAPPPLVAYLRDHIRQFGYAPDGRIFRSRYNNGPVSDSTYGNIWREARKTALTPGQAASPMARRPYDLRHAAVSLWLNSGVAPQQVAEWAGHSVNVLLRVYAKCLDGEQDAARRRVETALKLGPSGRSSSAGTSEGGDAGGEG